MATASPGAEDKLRFNNQDEVQAGLVERQLKRRYGRGIYIGGLREASDGTLFLTVGSTLPKNVSDCRTHDRVLKFIEFDDIFTLKAEPVENGYLIELPERQQLYDGFVERRRELARRLDRNMAQTIYEKLVGFTAVENQLGAIKEILRTVREHSPLPVQTIYEIRGPSNEEQTERYLRLLEDTEFIQIDEEETIRSDSNLDVHDDLEVGTKEFSEVVLGQVINRAFSTLRDELNLTLLAHYPKYANSYYFSALQRGEPSLRLDVESAHENLEMLHGDSVHEITVQQKLDDLAKVDVLETEGEYYRSNSAVYESLAQQPV